jgi:hypothetical protein
LLRLTHGQRVKRSSAPERPLCADCVEKLGVEADRDR